LARPQVADSPVGALPSQSAKLFDNGNFDVVQNQPMAETVLMLKVPTFIA
jgi:hypothetical protein